MMELSFGISNIIAQVTEDGKLKVDPRTVARLHKIYDLCEAALLSMLDDILIWFPPIQTHLDKCLERAAYSKEDAFEPQRPLRCVDMRLEEERLLKEGKTPDAITKEAALLQYVVHSRLDKWLEDMLVDMYSTVIPPNPFPTAVHNMRQLAMRLLYKDNRDEAMLQKTYKHEEVTQLGAGGHVYTKSHVVYGTYLAVCHVNPENIKSALEALKAFRNTSSKVRQGAFEMRVTTSLRNDCFTFADAVPQKLSRLSIVEDYFVTSLERDKAYDAFADAVTVVAFPHACDAAVLAGSLTCLAPFVGPQPLCGAPRRPRPPRRRLAHRHRQGGVKPQLVAAGAQERAEPSPDRLEADAAGQAPDLDRGLCPHRERVHRSQQGLRFALPGRPRERPYRAPGPAAADGTAF